MAIPERTKVPEKLREAILTYEDAHFYYHWGVNPISTLKALGRNLQRGRTVRGGSTITQQVIRLARKNPARSYTEKCIEAIWATRLEFRYSKEHILALYASHAPYGGNVVGGRYGFVALFWGTSRTTLLGGSLYPGSITQCPWAYLPWS